MMGRQLRAALIGELIIYALIGLWLSNRGWDGGAVLAMTVSLFLGLRAIIVGTSVVFTLADSSPVPPASRVGVFGFLRMAVLEYRDLIRLFVAIQPFERFWMGDDRLRPTPDRPPLLLIHGYHCNRGAWFWLRSRLEAAGWTVATHNLEPVLANIDSYAEGIERRIDAVLAATGAKRAILVGHSMGGLASRAYLRRYGTGKVERMISLASPHHGSRLAALAWGPNGRQMRIGSAWLIDLAEAPLPRGSVSIYSLHDNQVMPQRECSELAGARNVALPGISHLGMLFAPAVLAALLRELDASLTGEFPASSD